MPSNGKYSLVFIFMRFSEIYDEIKAGNVPCFKRDCEKNWSVAFTANSALPFRERCCVSQDFKLNIRDEYP